MFHFYWTLSPTKFIKKVVVYMSDTNQEGMVILHKLPRGLHCKTLVDLPFSKSLDVDLDCEILFGLLSLFFFYFW